jgi:NADH dehydrogenase FAD-containing subunit
LLTTPPDHLIGSPLALASESYTPKAWVRACDLPALRNNPHIRFLQGTATSLDASSRRLTVSPASGGANGKPGVVLEYDFLVAASGLDRPWPVVPQTVARKDYLAEAGAHIARVGRPDAVVLVVGGGAVGVEMAAELKLVHPHVRVVLAQSRDKLLASEGLPDECKDKALELLRETGVEVLMGHRVVGPVTDVDGGAWKEVEFSTGEKMLASHVVWAVSRPRPTSSYLPAGSLDAEGYVNILPR